MNALNLCEPQRKFCDMKTVCCPWPMTCDATFIHEPSCPLVRMNEKPLHGKSRFLQSTFHLNNGLSSVCLPSNLRSFYSGISSTLNCEVIKAGSRNRWYISRKALRCLRYEVHWLIFLYQKHSCKARCKKSYFSRQDGNFCKCKNTIRRSQRQNNLKQWTIQGKSFFLFTAQIRPLPQGPAT